MFAKFCQVLPALVPVGLYQQVQHSDLRENIKLEGISAVQSSLPWVLSAPSLVHCGSLSVTQPSLLSPPSVMAWLADHCVQEEQSIVFCLLN